MWDPCKEFLIQERGVNVSFTIPGKDWLVVGACILWKLLRFARPIIQILDPCDPYNIHVGKYHCEIPGLEYAEQSLYVTLCWYKPDVCTFEINRLMAQK